MGIGITELLVILGIVILLFGTKKLRNIGGDLGSAIHSFRKSMQESDATSPSTTADTDQKSSEALEKEAKPEKGDTKGPHPE